MFFNRKLTRLLHKYAAVQTNMQKLNREVEKIYHQILANTSEESPIILNTALDLKDSLGAASLQFPDITAIWYDPQLNNIYIKGEKFIWTIDHLYPYEKIALAKAILDVEEYA